MKFTAPIPGSAQRKRSQLYPLLNTYYVNAGSNAGSFTKEEAVAEFTSLYGEAEPAEVAFILVLVCSFCFRAGFADRLSFLASDQAFASFLFVFFSLFSVPILFLCILLHYSSSTSSPSHSPSPSPSLVPAP